MVIIDKETLDQEINTFLHENNITQINKDPTEMYQRQIQQALQEFSTIIEKERHKYLINKNRQHQNSMPMLKHTRKELP